MPDLKKYCLIVFIILVLSFQRVYALDTSHVVTCTSANCPMIAPILAPGEVLDAQAIIYQTSDSANSPEFMTRSTQNFSDQHEADIQSITLNQSDISDTYPIIGFGGAFTDSAAIIYHSLAPALQKFLIESYYGPTGTEYTLGRVPIASSDFSCRKEKVPGDKINGVPSLDNCSNTLSVYTYADIPDSQLKNFALQSEDIDFKIPMIKDAMTAVGNNHNILNLFASPWSAPAWMKTNGSMVRGSLLPEFQAAWAEYYIKFFREYKKRGITFWGVTVQNEPEETGFLGMKDLQTWQTMYSTKEDAAKFIRNYLGPALKAFENEYKQKINLIMHDDQITTILDRITITNDPELNKYISGAGFHWYMNSDSIFYNNYVNLDAAYTILNKDKLDPRFIIGTEACQGYLPLPGSQGTKLGDWSRGESYGHDILTDLNHHVSGWTDWNLILDMKGGPNWANNVVDSPVLVDIEAQTFYKQPLYYYMGHFSKFIKPGSLLLNTDSQPKPFQMEEVSFKVLAHNNLPTTIVIVVLNRDVTKRKYYIQDNSKIGKNKFLNMEIPAHGIQTIIYKANQ